MSISAVLDVMIGTAFVYLLLSLVVTAATEFISTLFKHRSRLLSKAIAHTLQDQATAEKFFGHPLVKALRQPAWIGKEPDKPSYIPSGTFAQVVLDLVSPGKTEASDVEKGLDGKDLPEELRRALKALFAAAGKDVVKFRAAIEQWFSDSMDRVSGWYKRQANVVVLVLSIGIVILANADTLGIIKTLWKSPTLRAALVAEAEAFAKQHADEVQKRVEGDRPEDGPPPQTPDVQPEIDAAAANLLASVNRLDEIALPLGWASLEDDPDRAAQLEHWDGMGPALQRHALGWLISVFAVSMGAPFWFDALNRLIAMRSAGKKPDTPDEKRTKDEKK